MNAYSFVTSAVRTFSVNVTPYNVKREGNPQRIFPVIFWIRAKKYINKTVSDTYPDWFKKQWYLLKLTVCFSTFHTSLSKYFNWNIFVDVKKILDASYNCGKKVKIWNYSIGFLTVGAFPCKNIDVRATFAANRFKILEMRRSRYAFKFNCVMLSTLHTILSYL